MSSKKITAADKLEIVDFYRHGGDTTASLANRYGVSNSTISRILKTGIPEVEYEVLIQQKRGLKVGIEDEFLSTIVAPSIDIPAATLQTNLDLNQPSTDLVDPIPSLILPVISSSTSTTEEDSSAPRKLRRRSSAPSTIAKDEPITVAEIEEPTIDRTPPQIPSSVVISTSDNVEPPPPISRTPVLREILADSESRYAPPIVAEIPADELEEDDDDTEDVNVLAAMFGEEVSDDDEEEDDDEDDSTTVDRPLDPNQLLTKDRLHVQITPLSQATLPRTCYIVIDKFAELIVRPLKDFADLGQIAGEETQQRTLPIFDNPRVAKRFSNQRTQRVIKVPDSKVFYKTTQHLKLKGITRLLVDGNIYSLN
ncbi:MAG: transposase [Chamaesiphon sp.]|nr:transposase [Chamaesiphon sp.]